MNREILNALIQIHSNGSNAVWLITVIGTEGSTPGKIGTKILVNANGDITGTIGGGGIEKRVIDKIMQEKPRNVVKWNFDLGGGFIEAEKLGMLCGGRQEVLVEPLFCAHELYIIGGGHCGRALSEFAAKCDFNVTVIDDRKDCATNELHPYANKVICAPYDNIDPHIDFSSSPFIVIMTHGHTHDELVMRKVLGKPYKYLGVIGSKNKSATLFDRLLKDGYAREELQRVFMPIGLNIGSQTPYEIAVSILAQILSVRAEVLLA